MKGSFTTNLWEGRRQAVKAASSPRRKPCECVGSEVAPKVRKRPEGLDSRALATDCDPREILRRALRRAAAALCAVTWFQRVLAYDLHITASLLAARHEGKPE